MDMVHGSKTKKKIAHSNENYSAVRTLANPPTSKSASNAYCSVCRDIGTCSFCVQKNNTMELTNIEFSPSNKKEPELREIKVESPNSPVGGGDNNGFPPDVLSSTPMAGNKSIVIDVENGTTKNKEAIKKAADRKWRYFPGKNRFFCNGRLIAAPNISFCLCCFLLIVVTFTLFIIFDGPYLADRWSLAVPILGLFMFLTVIVSMLKTTFSDPGIIPRASQQEAEYMERCYATNNVGRPPPRTKDVIVNGQTLKVKYCFTCKMFRPPRASHCGVCDNCVDRFDHHCPFLGNCIGKRNYRHFYAFVLSLSFLCVFVLSCATAHLVLISKERGNFLEALKESPTSAIVVVISFFGMWTVLGLAGFHTYLISVEQTTNEDIKGLFGRSAIKNPFSRGNIFLNCSFVLCGPLQPSLIDPRGKVTDDFLLSLPRKNDATGVPTSSICNRSSLHLQTSMKTGPQCVEASNRSGVAKGQTQQQQPTFTSTTSQPHQMHAQSNHQISTSGALPPTAKQVADGITLTSHSPDSGSGLLYTSNSSNRSLSNMNSGKEENFQNLQTFSSGTTNKPIDQHQGRYVCRRTVANSSSHGKTRPYSQGDFLERRRSVVLVSRNNSDASHVQLASSQKKLFNFNSYPYRSQEKEKSKSLLSLRNVSNSSKSNSKSFLADDDKECKDFIKPQSDCGGSMNNNNGNVVEIPSVKVVEVQRYSITTKNTISNSSSSSNKTCTIDKLDHSNSGEGGVRKTCVKSK